MTTDLILGDCRRVLQTLPAKSHDSCVTDPPYEIDFMGAAWDRSGAAFDLLTWRGVLRVLKPGAYLLAFGGTRTWHRLAVAIEEAGFEIRDTIMWVYGSGMPKSATQLKPAWEPIIVARKPCQGSEAANIRKWGTGGIQVETCRVEPTGESRERVDEPSMERRYGTTGATDFAMKPGVRGGDPAGRWPANFAHDGSPEVLEAFPETGKSTGGRIRSGATGRSGIYGTDERVVMGDPGYGDSGSAARFFYCAKATPADRGDGNTHQTVKPNALMRYLCRLVTPPGGRVLDNFMGSGSTGKAAVQEGFGFTGITNLQAHVDIARRRIDGAGEEAA